MRIHRRSLLQFFLLLQLVPAIAFELNPQQMVDAHNVWRHEVGSPPLEWAKDLAAGAEQWARHLESEKACRMEHSSAEARQKTGENLYWASPVRWSDGRLELQRVPPAKVVKAWADERVDYDHRRNTCAAGKQCGHYTQVVWRNTRQLGCASRQCADQSQVWVCRYRPAGNWIGERPY